MTEENVRLIDVMITFNFSYIQQRTAIGENVLGVEPHIDTVAYFSGTHQMKFKELLKERVKRNIRLKSDNQEMPISINL